MKYVVECRPDEALVASLTTLRPRRIVHRSGKPEVLKYVRRTEETIGVIDDDPSSIQPPMLQQLQEFESMPHLNLKRSRFPNGNVIITLTPRLEEWILDDCRRAGITMEHYGLPSDSEAFHDIVNQRLNNFARLISDLRNGSERLQRLTDWLQHLPRDLSVPSPRES